MTVYLTQQMKGRDMSDATSFGDLEILIDSDEQVSFSTQPTIRRMNRKLNKFNDDDYILLAGDPAAIAIAGALAAKNNRGRFKMLKWDRQQEKYFPLQADIYNTLGGNDGGL